MALGMHLDQTLELNEEIRFKKKNQEIFEDLLKNVHFNRSELDHVLLIYYKIAKSQNQTEVTKKQMGNVLHYGLQLTDYRLLDKILSVVDKGVNPNVTLENWAKMCSLFSRGSIEEKLRFAFTVYQSGSRKSRMLRNHILQLLKHSLIKETADEDADAIDEGVKDMVDMIIKKIDADRDGKISFEDYRQAVLNNPLMLEVFGPVIPSRLSIYSFLSTFSNIKNKV